MKKLTIEITDLAALEAAFPDCVETVVTKHVNRSKLRPLVNALYAHGKQVDGVKAYYSGEEPLLPFNHEPFSVRAGLLAGASGDTVNIPASLLTDKALEHSHD